MSRKPFIQWNPLWILLAYLVASNTVASAEDLLEMYVQTDANGLLVLKWTRMLARVGVFVVFGLLLKIPKPIIFIGLVILYFSVYSFSGNFIANSCALLLGWVATHRYSKTQSDSSLASNNEQQVH
jgi:hypothetical protein